MEDVMKYLWRVSAIFDGLNAFDALLGLDDWHLGKS